MKRRILYLVTLFVTASTIAACSDESSNDNPDVVDSDGDTSVSDVEDGSDSTIGDGSDTDDGSDDGREAEVIEPGSRVVGESCISGVQCASQLCVTFETGVEGFCSQICDQTVDCPSASSGGTFQCLKLPQNSNDDLKGCIDTSFCYDPDDDGYGVGPGCDKIGFDCDQSDATINAGATESCDGVDRNCNGLVIDSVVFDEPSCTLSDQIGACAVGGQRCEPTFASDGETVTGGTVTCEQVVFPGELDEVCNGVDDDCDGIRDDFVSDEGVYEVAGLGVSCATNVDACPNGRTTCDVSSGEITCVATGENPTGGDETLVCDGIDNNCNGETDEPFKNEDGIYFMADNCGSCDVNCDNFWDGRPQDFNVVPFCSVNETFAVCAFDCVEGFVNADGLDDNGCELNPDETAIYVTRPARGGVDSDACGPYTAPCATIAYAMNKAQADSEKSRVRVAEGSYGESVELINGVSVLGGHNATNFVRNVDANVTTLTGTKLEANQIFVVRGNGINEATEFSGFSIRAPAARDGRSSIGVLLIDSTQALTVSDNRVVAGAGGSGVTGAPGTNGQPGANGGAGIGSRNNRNNCGDDRAGGAGGDRVCADLRGSGTERVNGGNGAAGDGCPEFGTAQAPGQAGQGTEARVGTAGLSQHHQRGFVVPGFRSCRLPTEGQITDGTTLVRFTTAGGRGGTGDDGQGGSGADDASGSTTGDSWVGESGASGQPGVYGSGGGGGGAPSGVEDVRDSNSEYYYPASGGGGGSGGCAGSAGQGGSAGGGSFAIVIVQTGAPGAAPVLTGNRFSRGDGGNGGSGGAAGSGGDGGAGGAPGVGDNESNDYGFCMANGEFGGAGGRGGHGGGGGGGAGGASFDVLIVSSNADATAAATGAVSNNEFPLTAGEATGGNGGAGGSSQSNVGIGGVDGASGRLLKLQP